MVNAFSFLCAKFKWYMKKITFLIICIFSHFAFSQDDMNNNNLSTIYGTVYDSEKSEPIVGAFLFLDGGQQKAQTDLDGKFSFHQIEFGVHKILVKTVEYPDTIVTVNVVGVTPVEVSIYVEAKFTEIGIVHVKPKRTLDQEKIDLIKKNPGGIEIINQAVIARSPITTATDVIAKGSGTSVQDNKFVVVRGLNDRYNAAFLNGAPLPSSESDRKAFSFDIFPANMLEYLSIQKTATPELSGEFAGGVIDIKTKDVPEESFQSLTIGGGYNTITTGKEQVYYKGGKYDWLGIDDGSREISSAIPSKANFPLLMSDQAKLAKDFTTNWGTNSKNFAPNYNMQYTIGLTDTLFGKEVGLIGSLTYNRKNNYNTTIRRSYSANEAVAGSASEIETDYLDKVYSTQILAGSMLNLTMKFNQHNKVSFKNVYNLNSDNRLINRTGERDPLESNPTQIKSNAYWFTSNNIYSGQLIGEHLSKNDKLRFDWVGGYSDIKRSIPNLRRSIYTRSKYLSDPTNPNPEDTMYVANISQTNVGPSYGGGMFFSENKESIISFKGNLSYHLDTIAGIATEIKVGGMYQYRDRDFNARQLGYTRYGISGGNVNFDNSLLFLPEDSIFQAQNMGLISPGVGGFKLTDGTKFTDGYIANSNTKAGFVSFDNRFRKKFRLHWGARAEYFSQYLSANIDEDSLLVVESSLLDVLPSMNFIYSHSKKQNYRLSASQTLNRPEYRELAPFAFYDFNTQFVLSGNPELKRSKITNLDLKYEWFPGNGQFLSGTFFYKYFENPIEQIVRADVTNEISYKNVPYATNYGFEIDFKGIVGLMFHADSNSFANRFSISSNLAIIRSNVDVSKNVGTQYASRPLQGQSPYVFNGSLSYLDEANDMTMTLTLNNVGSRIYILGSINQPDIWEKSRTFIDFQIQKSFFKNKLDLKINFQNLLAQNQLFYQNKYNVATDPAKGFDLVTNSLLLGDKNNINGYDKDVDDLVWSTTFGRTFSFSLTYKF